MQTHTAPANHVGATLALHVTDYATLLRELYLHPLIPAFIKDGYLDLPYIFETHIGVFEEVMEPALLTLLETVWKKGLELLFPEDEDDELNLHAARTLLVHGFPGDLKEFKSYPVPMYLIPIPHLDATLVVG